jgi:hypothetical protein
MKQCLTVLQLIDRFQAIDMPTTQPVLLTKISKITKIFAAKLKSGCKKKLGEFSADLMKKGKKGA